MHYSDTPISLDDESRQLILENQEESTDFDMHNDTKINMGQEGEEREEDYEDLLDGLQQSAPLLYTLRDIVSSK